MNLANKRIRIASCVADWSDYHSGHPVNSGHTGNTSIPGLGSFNTVRMEPNVGALGQ